MQAPYMYDYINSETYNVNPSTVHAANTATAAYYRRYLLQKAMSVFEWSMPDNWDRDYFLYTLYTQGRVAVFNSGKFGVIPQQCTLGGYDVYYRPNTAVVTNACLSPTTRELKINKDCVLFKLQPDYGGCMDLVYYYSNLMALAAETAMVNLHNSKMSYIGYADNKAGAESLKKALDNISRGDTAVILDPKSKSMDGKEPFTLMTQNVGSNYIVTNILQDMTTIENEFCTAVGLPNANTQKKERLITDEVNANNAETHSVAGMWLNSLKKSCDDVGKMFGVTVTVDWANQPDMTGGVDLGAADNSRDV